MSLIFSPLLPVLTKHIDTDLIFLHVPRLRHGRDLTAMPAVLESTHPLMQKFQESLRQFLEKENELAEKEIVGLVSGINHKSIFLMRLVYYLNCFH